MIVKRDFDPRRLATYVWKDVTLALVVTTVYRAATMLYPTRLCCTATPTASVRLATPSLPRMLWTW